MTIYALFGTDACDLGGRVPARSADYLFAAEIIFDHGSTALSCPAGVRVLQNDSSIHGAYTLFDPSPYSIKGLVYLELPPRYF